MFADRDLLISEFSKLIGIYQSNSVDYPELAPSLVSSSKRRFVDATHDLINLEYIDQSKRNFSAYPYDAWGGDTEEYLQRKVVKDSGNYYEAIQNVTTGIDISDTDYWFPLDDLNLYLIQSREHAIDTTLDAVFNDKKNRQKIKNIYENIALFKGVAFLGNAETNSDKFVGLRFRVKTDRDLVTIINKIGHQFTEAIDFNLYLYHSSQETPLATIPISHTKAGSSQWTDQTGLDIRYLSDDYDAGGEFFLGYAQSDLGTAKALVKSDIDWYGGMCCQNRPLWDKYSNYIDVVGFSVPESGFTVGTDIFDIADVTISYTNNYGLNCNMTTKCDLTPFFLQENDMFAEAINYQWGLNLMRGMAASTRGTNGLSNQVAEKARNEIFTFPDAKGTLLDRANMALKGLNFDLSGLNSDCLACKNPTATDGSLRFEIVVDNPLGI